MAGFRRAATGAERALCAAFSGGGARRRSGRCHGVPAREGSATSRTGSVELGHRLLAGTYLTAAAALVIAGVVIGVLIVICLGIHREERRGSLTRQSDNRMDRGVRRLNGAGSRGCYLRVVPNDDDSNYDDDSSSSYDQAA